MKEILAAIGLVVALPALIIVWMSDVSPERAAAKEQKSFETKARVMCSTRIERSLRNPASVEWRDMAAWPIIEDGGDIYTVIAKYRAENGFGGMVPETRQCLVRRNGKQATAMRIE